MIFLQKESLLKIINNKLQFTGSGVYGFSIFNFFRPLNGDNYYIFLTLFGIFCFLIYFYRNCFFSVDKKFSSSVSSSVCLEKEDKDAGCPDFGFIYSSDGSSCDMITAAHGIISADEVRAITGMDATCHDALVLTIKVLSEVLSKQNENVDHIIQKYREQNGKSYSLQLMIPDVSKDRWDQLMHTAKSKKLKTEATRRKSYFPSYKTKMNAETSKIDPRTKPFNEMIVKQRGDFNVHEHNPTAFLHENYREIYN